MPVPEGYVRNPANGMSFGGKPTDCPGCGNLTRSLSFFEKEDEETGKLSVIGVCSSCATDYYHRHGWFDNAHWERGDE